MRGECDYRIVGPLRYRGAPVTIDDMLAEALATAAALLADLDAYSPGEATGAEARVTGAVARRTPATALHPLLYSRLRQSGFRPTRGNVRLHTRAGTLRPLVWLNPRADCRKYLTRATRGFHLRRSAALTSLLSATLVAACAAALRPRLLSQRQRQSRCLPRLRRHRRLLRLPTLDSDCDSNAECPCRRATPSPIPTPAPTATPTPTPAPTPTCRP